MLHPQAFREVVRSVTVSYPVPFVFAAMLAFAVAPFGGALLTAGALRWLLAAVGVSVVGVALFIVLYGILRKPQLLRSERFELAHRVLDLIGDSDMDEATRGRLLEGAATQILGRNNISIRQLTDESDRKEENEGSNV